MKHICPKNSAHDQNCNGRSDYLGNLNMELALEALRRELVQSWDNLFKGSPEQRQRDDLAALGLNGYAPTKTQCRDTLIDRIQFGLIAGMLRRILKYKSWLESNCFLMMALDEENRQAHV